MPPTHDPDSLDELVLRAGADIRSPLLRTLVDLYLQKPTHTAEEAQHFTELTLRLLEQADLDTRDAIARRLASYPSAPAPIMLWLAADRPDVAVLVRPAGGEPGPILVTDAPRHERVAPAELSDLFFAANAAERRLILLNLTYAPPPAAAAVTGNTPEAARQLEAAALAHNPDAFMRTLERWLGIAPALARRIVHDPLGEPIVVAAKVLSIAPDAVQRILLFINPVVGRSVHRVYELAMLFESIDAEAAHALVDIWRAANPRPDTAQTEATDRRPRRVSPNQTIVAQREPADASRRIAVTQR